MINRMFQLLTVGDDYFKWVQFLVADGLEHNISREGGLSQQ